ncbi:MAG: DUF2203 domain-containing protein [Chloroflexota bacterium]|nr:DUF2203 domain-containing protein [Chloroflexota bacterium]
MARYFTLAEANALLPRLRQWLTRMQAKKRRLDQVQEKLVELAIKAAGNGRLVEKDLHAAEQEAERLAREIDKWVERISALGCEVKDVERGLIDFLARREGREVYLCWQLGEEEVAFWHELQDGFDGRQPL